MSLFKTVQYKIKRVGYHEKNVYNLFQTQLTVFIYKYNIDINMRALQEECQVLTKYCLPF